jgi:hypothetical protein
MSVFYSTLGIKQVEYICLGKSVEATEEADAMRMGMWKEYSIVW